MDTQTEVLIIDSGPAGLMSATWLASQGVSVEIVEKHAVRPARGRAGGFEPRTLEVLDSFGLLDTWFKKANRTVDLCVWAASHRQHLERVMRQPNSSCGSSRFYESTMDQSVLEQSMEDHLYQNHGVQVQYDTECLALQRTPSSITLISKQSGVPRRHTASYVIGADGASSWTRKEVGIEMEGSKLRQQWGVVDIYPLTDFPDIRSRCIVHREGVSTLMVIPREAGMIRLYIQLDDATTASCSEDAAVDTVAIAKRILEPYTLDYKICH